LPSLYCGRNLNGRESLLLSAARNRQSPHAAGPRNLVSHSSTFSAPDDVLLR
jgi:hypothetical protein